MGGHGRARTEGVSGAQREMLRLLALGYDVVGVAGAMGYSVGYMYIQIREMRESLDVATNAAAVAEGLRLGVIGIPEREEIRGIRD